MLVLSVRSHVVVGLIEVVMYGNCYELLLIISCIIAQKSLYSCLSQSNTVTFMHYDSELLVLLLKSHVIVIGLFQIEMYSNVGYYISRL